MAYARPMETLALVFVMLLMAGLSALPIYFTWWLPKRRSEAWTEAATRLGLRLEAPPSKYHPAYFGRIVGERDGWPISCGVRSTGSRNSTTYYTKVTVELPHSLDAHLDARPVGALGRMWSGVTGENDIQLGHADIDPFYSISGLEDRVSLILGQSEVTDALRRHAKASFGLRVSDHRVCLEARGLQLDADTLGPVVDAATDVANRLIRAHGAVQSEPRWQAMTSLA